MESQKILYKHEISLHTRYALPVILHQQQRGHAAAGTGSAGPGRDLKIILPEN